jgi:hypothetical protein
METDKVVINGREYGSYADLRRFLVKKVQTFPEGNLLYLAQRMGFMQEYKSSHLITLDGQERVIKCVCGGDVLKRYQFPDSMACQCNTCKNVYFGKLGDVWDQIKALEKGNVQELKGFFP